MHHRNLLRVGGAVLSVVLAASSSPAYNHFPRSPGGGAEIYSKDWGGS